jgi:predicted O-methyltransferase YrrM
MGKMNLLDELAIKYGADKTPQIKHHYTDVYFDLFGYKRNEVKKVLEIGVAEGASLYMWRDFFPNATIYGAEIDQKRVDALQGLDRIEVFRCDQSTYDLFNVKETSAAGYGFDLIVDDGSHKPSDQIFTALTYLSKMPRGSVYVIEDVDDKSVGQILVELREYEPKEYHVGSRHDDRLIICQK